jgi:hypothetical protein
MHHLLSNDVLHDPLNRNFNFFHHNPATQDIVKHIKLRRNVPDHIGLALADALRPRYGALSTEAVCGKFQCSPLPLLISGRDFLKTRALAPVNRHLHLLDHKALDLNLLHNLLDDDIINVNVEWHVYLLHHNLLHVDQLLGHLEQCTL